MKDAVKMLGHRLLSIGDELEQWGLDLADGSLEPLCYLEDRGEYFLVSAELPIVDKKDVHVFLTGDALEISARMKRTCTFRRMGSVESQYEFRSLRKALALPSGIDADKARARFKKGILEIKLPKKTHPRQLDVE